MNKNKLAFYGGTPLRTTKMPFREAYGEKEASMIMEVSEYYRKNKIDPPYSGTFEKKLCENFSKYMGGGYTDAVATGTIACYIAIASLNLKKNSDILISPVTDSGPFNAIIMLGFNPIIIDSEENSYNINAESLEKKITRNTSAAFIVHAAGSPVAMGPVMKLAKKYKIKIIEDCSQAIGASCCGKNKDCNKNCDFTKSKKVGTFGDIAAFSTMYRKNLASGGSGGLVYSKKYSIFKDAVAHADRGRPKFNKNYDPTNPGDALFPALNFHTNEFSSGIAIASLKRLESNNEKRKKFLKLLILKMEQNKLVTKPHKFHNGFAPFFFPLMIDPKKIKCSKNHFFKCLRAEGIDIAIEYPCIISQWKLSQPYIKNQRSHNAEYFKEISSNLFLNENYGKNEVEDIINALKKIENIFVKK